MVEVPVEKVLGHLSKRVQEGLLASALTCSLSAKWPRVDFQPARRLNEAMRWYRWVKPTQQMEIQASHLAKCERWKFFYQEKVKLMDFDLLRPDLHLQKWVVPSPPCCHWSQTLSSLHFLTFAPMNGCTAAIPFRYYPEIRHPAGFSESSMLPPDFCM